MTKGIIVLDIPESCDECQLESRYLQCCTITGKDTFINGGMDRFEKRLFDCPIQPLPIGYYSADQDEMSLYCKGFNKCLEEILRGEEDASRSDEC